MCESRKVREEGGGKKGVDVKAGREGIGSLVSCTGGRESVADLALTRGDGSLREWKTEKKTSKFDMSGGRSDAIRAQL